MIVWAAGVVACSDAPAINGADAGVRADGGPLPPAFAFLAPDRYDCTASGPFLAPPRPYTGPCHKDPACTERLVSAHRIATPYAPENSITSLRAAILLGADMVETDLRITRDGRVVLLHDRELDRTATSTGNVDEMTLARLREIPLKVGDHLAGGDFACERIPTLEEALDLARGQIVMELEVKNLEAGIAAARLLKARDLYDDAFILCDPGECRAVRDAVPDVPIMPRPDEPPDVPGILTFDPPAIMVHIEATDAFLEPDLLASIRGIGAKVFVNGIVQSDPRAALGGDLGGYLELYDRGIDVVLVENVHWTLLALGRLQRP